MAKTSSSNSNAISVVGLWHLGLVSAGCLSRHFPVTAIDADSVLVDNLLKGITPISEPGLDQLLTQQVRAGRLTFQSLSRPLPEHPWLWLAIDTPIDTKGYPMVEKVTSLLDLVIPRLAKRTTVIINSQLPVGTTRQLESKYPQHEFCYVPENLRLGSAIRDFQEADRLVIGCRKKSTTARLKRLLAPLQRPILEMSPESAELSKHTLNSFLATSIVFANEVAAICPSVGATASDVLAALTSDKRIGPRAYLSPGPGYAGGTLERDVLSLNRLLPPQKAPLIRAISRSNKNHLNWILQKIQRAFLPSRRCKILVIGLVYKKNTSTLRGSNAVRTVKQLQKLGYNVSCFDPCANSLEAKKHQISLLPELPASLHAYKAVLIEPVRPDLYTPRLRQLLRSSKCQIFDAGGTLEDLLRANPRYHCPFTAPIS
jgi:UDPglucose 6-dehydrogenase